MALMFAVVEGRDAPDQATMGVKVPVCTDALGMTFPENPFGRLPRHSMMSLTVAISPLPVSPAMIVGTAST